MKFNNGVYLQMYNNYVYFILWSIIFNSRMNTYYLCPFERRWANIIGSFILVPRNCNITHMLY